MFYNKEKKKYSTQMFLKMLFEKDMYKYIIITVFYLGFLNCCQLPSESIELQKMNEEKEDNFLDTSNDISIKEKLIKKEENLVKKKRTLQKKRSLQKKKGVLIAIKS